MGYEAKILADSLSPAGVRLTTMQITFPRMVLAEFNTHRVFSRNSASSRAIPVEKRIEDTRARPFIPAAFGQNKRGMQAGEDVDEYTQAYATEQWTEAARECRARASNLASVKVHKQHANRLLEFFSWHTVIVTSTNWRNFFALRCSPLAQPEIRTIAEMMCDVMEASEPQPLKEGEWHLPLVAGYDAADIVTSYDVDHAARVSCARCARVSYLTHEGKRDVEADLALADRLASDGHMSPFEHAARPATLNDAAQQLRRIGVTQSVVQVENYGWDDYDNTEIDLRKFPFGNLRGWCSLRWTLPNEAVFGGGEP